MTVAVQRPAPGEHTPPPGAGSPPRPSWRSRLHVWEGRSAPYVYIAPFFLVFGAFGLFPLLYTAWISLHSYRLGSRMRWNGGGDVIWLFFHAGVYHRPRETVLLGRLS